jgi:hypothetical protein
MTSRPDERALRAFFARIARRLGWLSAIEGASAGLAIACLLALLGWPARGALAPALIAGFVLAAAGVSARMIMQRRRQPRVALLVERRAPHCRNLLITADELLADGGVVRARASDYLGAVVCREAARLATALDPTALFPGRNAIAALAASGALWALALVRLASPAPVGTHALLGTGASSTAAIERVDVSVTPPAYAGRPAPVSALRDPARIEALVGSRIHVAIHADAASIAVETLHGRVTLTPTAPRTFTADLPADADGYIALEPATSTGRAGVRRLIGVSVIADNAPRVRIKLPGRDLFLRDAHQTIDLGIEASDDIGLASLKMRYTKVSGSGERFTFTEGEVPLDVARASARGWTATAHWALDGLGLAPGDMVVYRAVAADYRPGATPSESDSFIAEIVAPGNEAASGFSIDPDQERYAVSQQMVILKTERLLARRASMAAEAYGDAAQEIALEQRKVRAEFVFMMGGELADAPDPAASMTDLNEAAEAEGESDLAAGRMANQGRVALLAAIRAMSRAGTLLTTADLTPALAQERTALAQLERAFSRTRIILRALTERERLDLSRRLSGSLTDAARDTRASADPTPDPRVASLRRALAGIATLAGTAHLGVSESSQASMLAERVLQVDPSSKPLQDVAAVVNSAAASIGRGQAADARRELDRAATALAAALRSDLLNAPRNAPMLDLSGLNGALTDALRHRGGAR